MASHATIWTSLFITASTATLWMALALKTVQVNSTQRWTLKHQNPVEFTKLTTRLFSGWLVMVWILSLRTSTLQLKWKSRIGFAFQEWVLTLTDVEAISTGWKVQKKSLDGTLKLKRILTKSRFQSQEFNISEKINDYLLPINISKFSWLLYLPLMHNLNIFEYYVIFYKIYSIIKC